MLPINSRVNHFVNAYDMVKDQGLDAIYAEASLSHIYIPSKTPRLGAPAHPPLYLFNEESEQR